MIIERLRHFTEKTAVFGDRSVSEKIEHLAGVFGLSLCRDWRGRRDRHHRHVLHGMQADVSLQGWETLEPDLCNQWHHLLCMFISLILVFMMLINHLLLHI